MQEDEHVQLLLSLQWVGAGRGYGAYALPGKTNLPILGLVQSQVPLGLCVHRCRLESRCSDSVFVRILPVGLLFPLGFHLELKGLRVHFARVGEEWTRGSETALTGLKDCLVRTYMGRGEPQFHFHHFVLWNITMHNFLRNYQDKISKQFAEMVMKLFQINM